MTKYWSYWLKLTVKTQDVSQQSPQRKYLQKIHKRKRGIKVCHYKKNNEIQRETKREENRNKGATIQKTTNKITAVSPSLSIITLNVDGLTSLPNQKTQC